MPFQFIDNAAIDHATRKRIRSHVAMGKNVGKKLTRPSRKKASEAKPSPFRPLKAGLDSTRLSEENKTAPEIERQIGDGMCFPVPLSSETRGIVRKAFYFVSGPRQAPELTDAIEPTNEPSSIWVKYMLVDEAYFHCTMATFITILNRLETQPDNATKAIQHLSQTFRLINERMSGADAVSDRTIAAVVGMAQYERMQAHYRRGFIHVQGLRQMAKLRGGIRNLKRQMPDLTKKMFRVDLEHSLQLGSSTLFSVDDVVSDSVLVYGCQSISMEKDQDNITESDSIGLQQLRPELRFLFSDTKCVASLLNEATAGRRPKLDAAQLHETILQLGYRLLSINTLAGVRPSGCLDNLVHIVLAAFIMTLMVGLDRKVAENPLLSDLARASALEQFRMEKGSKKVLLWLLFIGTVSLFKEQDETWLVARTRQIMGSLDVRTWVEVRLILLEFPWVEVLHKKDGYLLWQKASQKGSEKACDNGQTSS